MSLDPLLPIAPARVRALVVPIGQIKKDRFAAFVERLNTEHVVHLRDITPDKRPNRNMFSPLAFPNGAMFYDLTTHVPPPSHLSLSPFDLYREPLALIAIADGSEIETTVFSKRQSASGRTLAERNMRNLDQDLEELIDTYPKMLVHRVLLFDYIAPPDNPIPIPPGVVTIPPAEQLKRTTMKTVMCDISSLLLAEMNGLAKTFEAMSFIDSPGQSAVVNHANGTSWQDEGSSKLARRNSQFIPPTTARSASATGVTDRSHVRMSMPPVPFKTSPFGSSSSTPARPSTPVRSGLANPPTTFDDIHWNGDKSETASPDLAAQAQARPGTAEGFRAQSQERVSVQGFGSGGLNDRWRNKGRCRVQIVTGSLYLQAGRWSDAIKELVEGATLAKSINDHVWHGKALELTLVSLLLLGWAGIEFQVPTILLPPQEKSSSASASAQEAESRDPDQPRWMRNLQVIIPELTDRILGLYSRISAEHLPPLPLSEATIRLCKILSALHVSDGQLGKDSLDMVVRGIRPENSLTTTPRFTITPTRSQITSTLFRAFPSSESELLTTIDRVVILGGIVSVLGVLGFHRKKAMVTRELVSVLISGLVEARTRGAAEVGIHPAAGLVALNGLHGPSNGAVGLQIAEGDVEQGIDAFLGLLLKTYGVVTYDYGTTASGDDGSAAGSPTGNIDSATIARIQKQSAARCFGTQNIKIDVLRACISFSEALPDFAGVLRYSSDLLRTAGAGIAPGPRREDAAPAVSKDEQVRLATNISKTSNLSKRLGMDHLTAEYWDEFLLRGAKLEPLAATRTPIPHAKSILPDATTARASQDVNPFIYNPFLKQPDKAAVDRILVAGEPASFKLTLQNTYEIEIEIDRIRLDTEGVDFESSVESTVIGPYRTQILKLTGTAKTSGPLKITGAIIQVRGCRERRFPIFPQPWVPQTETKIKAIGVSALDKHINSAPSGNPLKPEQLELNVIAEQPVVAVKSSTLPQSSVMILEGERQTFSVTLQNLSTTTPVDFLLFSFKDSTLDPLQAALSSREATSSELYEYELILAKKQALRLRNGADKKRFIAPGQTATFEFEILGKPGLTNGLIQIDYAYLGVPHDEVGEKFYTRQVSLELTVTVNASIEVARIDVLPLHGAVPEPLWTRTGHGDYDHEITADRYFLLMLDLRNAWPSDMNIQLDVEGGAAIEEHILPGNTTRMILPMKRVYLDDPHAFIPALNPSRQRQFVVSTKISPDVERANREAFWYRERLLDSLKGSWKSMSGAPRSGTIELRSMRLTPRMIDAIKVDEVGIEISVRNPEEPQSDEGKTNVVFVDEFVELNVRVTNRTDQPIYPFLRIMPALCHRPLNVALDFTRKFAFNGTLQQTLPLLQGKSSVDASVGVTALCRGEFEITASVDETRLWTPATEEEKKRASARPRSETQTMMDAALGAKERRIWHSRQPCHLVVRDRE